MEDDLKKLSRLSAPKASDEARARAMAAAMTAFENSEKTATAPQGSEAGHRQSSIATTLWSLFMSRKMMLASSALATLLVVPAAGYVTYQMINERTIILTQEPVVVDTKTPADDARLRREKLKREQTASDKQTVAGKDTTPKQPEVSGLIEKTETKPDPVIADQKADETAGRKDTEVAAPVEEQRLAAEPKKEKSADLDATVPGDANAAATTAEAPEGEMDDLALAKPSTVQTYSAKRLNNLGGAMQNEGIVAQPPVLLPEESGGRTRPLHRAKPIPKLIRIAPIERLLIPERCCPTDKTHGFHQ